ncbi:hypothetical protein [Agitococcus lubricus]|uniref:Uncharacterized protein n=1 Tax=Agitococcus lubricus TaxID=1077255 RepID=A0A2T5J0N3_9GAMM|nr:hypothetical protein [Agitococcus lubricus]PTQ89902.1 hypothetical protein C8N29_105231 [Agitococcus lubricus]
MDLADKFIQFAESGNQQRLSSKDGRLLQGWIMEITDDALLISLGEGERGQDIWLSFNDIDPLSLAYWHSQSQQWQTFRL